MIMGLSIQLQDDTTSGALGDYTWKGRAKANQRQTQKKRPIDKEARLFDRDMSSQREGTKDVF